MNIAVNTRWLLPNKLEGTGVYTLNILRELVAAFPEHQFHLLFDRPSAARAQWLTGSNIHHHTVLPPARHPKLWWVWNRLAVGRVLKKLQIDLYWSPDGFAARTTCPQWITIHDLNFEHHPEWVPAPVARYYKKYMRRSAEEAQRIFTVSHWSAEDLHLTYGVERARLGVTYNAPQQTFRPGPRNLDAPYFCAVGALTPRKNLITLLRAFNRWLEQHPERRNFSLRIAGTAHFKDPALEAEIANMAFAPKVHWMGRLQHEQLQALYSGATAYCMPSAMEGFGIPLVEAMQCDTPVIAANNSALTEVVGNAGLLVSTYSVEAWAEALEQLAKEPDAFSGLGLKRSAQFTWARGAQPLIEALQLHAPRSGK